MGCCFDSDGRSSIWREISIFEQAPQGFTRNEERPLNLKRDCPAEEVPLTSITTLRTRSTDTCDAGCRAHMQLV